MEHVLNIGKLILLEHNYFLKEKRKTPYNLGPQKQIFDTNALSKDSLHIKIENEEANQFLYSNDITVKDEVVDFPTSNLCSENDLLNTFTNNNAQTNAATVIKSEPPDVTFIKSEPVDGINENTNLQKLDDSRKTEPTLKTPFIVGHGQNSSIQIANPQNFTRKQLIDHVLLLVKMQAAEKRNSNMSVEKKRVLRFIEKFCKNCNRILPTRYTTKDFKCCPTCTEKVTMRCKKCDKECDIDTFPQFHLYKCFSSIIEDIHYEICTTCQKKFSDATSFMSHIKSCGKNKYYFCDDCSFKTIYKSNISNHVRKHLNARYLTNSKEVDEVPLFDTATGKVISRRPVGCFLKFFKRYCPACNESVMNSAYYDRKTCSKCKGKMSLQCLKCDLIADTYSQMIYHLKHMCSPKIHTCSKCKKKFDF